MISVVAARYAKALADVVSAHGAALGASEVLRQLRGIGAMIDGSSDLRNALASPAVAPSRKRSVIAKLIAPMNVAPQVKNFLFVLIDHRRVSELKPVIESFEALMNERAGLIRADVTSAQELNPAQRAALEVQLARLSGKQMRMQYSLDAQLLGGAVARVGSTVYDGSVRGQLERLRGKLASG